MSTSAIGTGLSGLQGFQNALGVSANNVANGLTANFKPQSASFQESAPAGSGVTVSSQLPNSNIAPSQGASGGSGPSGTNFTDEAVNQLVYKVGFEASAKTVSTANQMLGTLLDIHA